MFPPSSGLRNKPRKNTEKQAASKAVLAALKMEATYPSEMSADF
jgi:hypothetical protein